MERSDGTIMFPMRGSPPGLLPGYEYDPSNRFVQRPIVPECKYREYRPPKCNCPRMDRWCLKDNVIVTRLQCKKCGGFK